MQALAAAELLEDLGVDARAALGGLQVLDEHLDGPPDPDQCHRLAGVVEHDGQMGIFVTYFLEDLLGEYGRLGHGECRELADLEARHVVPGGADGDGCPA